MCIFAEYVDHSNTMNVSQYSCMHMILWGWLGGVQVWFTVQVWFDLKGGFRYEAWPFRHLCTFDVLCLKMVEPWTVLS